KLVSFNVSAVTGGSDALGDVVVQLDVGGRLVTGRGVAADVVEASARAYLAAVNRALRVVSPGGDVAAPEGANARSVLDHGRDAVAPKGELIPAEPAPRGGVEGEALPGDATPGIPRPERAAASSPKGE